LHCQQDSAQDHVDYCGKKASHPVRASLWRLESSLRWLTVVLW
jgi:hypothetical protein